MATSRPLKRLTKEPYFDQEITKRRRTEYESINRSIEVPVPVSHRSISSKVESSASAGVEVSAPSDAETPTSIAVTPSSSIQVPVSVAHESISSMLESSTSTDAEVSVPSESEYQQIMKGLCADELMGIKCRTPSSCAGGFQICPQYGNSKVCTDHYYTQFS